jgi:hypothetical protein
MAWWNWALVLWATGATAGMAGLAVVLSRQVERREGQLPESDDPWSLLDEADRPVTPETTVDVRKPLLALTPLRHSAPGRSR